MIAFSTGSSARYHAQPQWLAEAVLQNQNQDQENNSPPPRKTRLLVVEKKKQPKTGRNSARKHTGPGDAPIYCMQSAQVIRKWVLICRHKSV